MVWCSAFYGRRVVMGIFKTKTWSAVDIMFLKWSSALFGMIVGAYVSNFVKQYLWVFIVLVIVFGLKPLYSYWFKK
jgi:putative Mn2+ efflux pump MntP